MDSGREIPDLPAPPDARDRPRVGVDEWVARAEERAQGPAGLAGLTRRLGSAVPPPARLALFIAVAATLPFWMNRGDLFSYGIFTLLYALLDLGYVAFFGFGAYFYAELSSDQYGIHWPAAASIPIVVVATALLGLVLGIPSRRLLGDYLAIV